MTVLLFGAVSSDDEACNTVLIQPLTWGAKKVVENAGHGLIARSRDTHKHGAHVDEEKEDEGKAGPSYAEMANVTSSDLYEILGLGKVRYNASEDEIRRAYRQCILKFHPDKMEGGSTSSENDDEGFKALHRAYETLSDPNKRKLYDSSDNFDDNIPADKEPKSAEDFFKTYGPVFDRNSKWSTNKPCPTLGDDSTSVNQVHKFYDFWFNFQSWREFEGEDEYKLDDAECREERRWMERKNAKERVKRKNEENGRIRRLAETAYKWDPRLRRERQAEKDKKDAKRLAKVAEKEKLEQQQREEKEKQEKLLAEQKEAARLAKIEKDKAKKKEQQERSKLRAACNGSGVDVNTEILNKVCLSYGLEQLAAVTAEVEAEPTKADEIVRKHYAVIVGSERAAMEEKMEAARLAAQEEAQKKAAQKKEEASRPWSDEEMANLVKAYAKYPGGTTNRWETIAKFLGTGRSPDEVVAQVNSFRKAGTLGAKQVIKTTTAAPPAAAAATPPPPSTPTPPAPVTPAPVTPAPAAASSSPAATTNAPVDEEGWTADQQKCLESALQEFPGSIPADERWTKIASKVAGKTRKECIARYKSLRAKLMATKTN